MRALMTLAALLMVGLTGCFVDGKELLAPEDPRYAAMCSDTLVVHEDYVCRREATVGITIPNPLYKPPADSVAP